MKLIRTTVCIAALAFGTAAAAKTQAPNAPIESGGTSAVSKVRCATVELSGSRIRRTLCHTQQGWEMLGVDFKQK